jgi:hypothetical protein
VEKLDLSHNPLFIENDLNPFMVEDSILKELNMQGTNLGNSHNLAILMAILT